MAKNRARIAYELASTENVKLMQKLAECLKQADADAGQSVHWGNVNYVQVINCKLTECIRYMQAIEVASGIAASQQD